MKAIAIIEVPEGGEGKWYIDGDIRYTENKSLMKKFDKEMISLKPLNKIVKAGDRNLIIYERAWLYSHLEEEFEMQKKVRDWEKQNDRINVDVSY